MRSASRTVDRRCAMTIVVRPARSRLQRGEHDLLGDRVERRGRLVEDQDRRVLEDGARDAEPLALAARQAAAGFGDLGVVAIRQARDELVRVRALAAPADFLVGRVEPAVAEVVGDRAARTAPDPAARSRCARAATASVVLADVDAVDQHAARRRVVEARNQADERRLAGAGQADERDHLAGLAPRS